MSDRCKGGCGLDFDEFPEMRHAEDDCPGPDCTCYELIGGHQQGCYFYHVRSRCAELVMCGVDDNDPAQTMHHDRGCPAYREPQQEAARQHESADPYRPICKYCGLADIAGDWDLYPCNDEWRKVIATQP